MESVTWWKQQRHNSGNEIPPLVVQEVENPAPGPDMNPPADADLYEIDADDRDVADDKGAPPFTGEDVEDVGDRPDDRLPRLPTM